MKNSGLRCNINSTFMTLVILHLLSVSISYAEIIYVDSVATGANDGTSWNDAYVDLQAAIDAASPGDKVWVAAGTYSPTSWPNGGSEDREKHFSLKNGVGIFGGFSGMETSLNERDVEINETILSGDIGTEGDSSDNCFHVFYHPEGTDLDTTAVLDGFIITESGGSGGMYNYSSSPTLSNCTFNNNSAGYGGSMKNYKSSPTLTNCIFSRNSAIIGGGMYNSFSSPNLISCTFSGNSASNYGGGIYNDSSSPTLTNCSFSGNYAFRKGSGMSNYYSSSPILTNCILWENDVSRLGNEVYNSSGSTPIFAYCDIKGSFSNGVWDEELGTDGGHNIDTDPLFVRNPRTNGADDPGDLHLTSDSPCIDMGDNNAVNIAGTDLYGESRIVDGVVDMGADEYLDADHDSMPDYWETRHDIDDPYDDPDGDGLINQEETISGTDPTREDSDGDGLADGQEDYDRDGLSNSNEVLHGTKLNDRDTDEDGYNDGGEILHGSDPASLDSTPEDSTTIYVDFEATGDSTGRDWDNAYIELDTALIASIPGDEIWVVAGTYRPTSWPNGGIDDRSRHFSLRNGVSLYGGFAGTETSLNERDVGINETILSGDIGSEGDSSDNCFHVFYHPRGTDLDGSAVLDGFTITGGNANVSDHHSGSGMCNYESSPIIANCTFSGNSASYMRYVPTHPMEGRGPVINYFGQGGGMYNVSSSPELINCTFSGNSTDSGGGGMYNVSSSSELINCTFNSNSAGRYGYGGGMHNYESSPTLTNCILWNNNADAAGNEVYNSSGSTPLFAYCNIKGASDSGVWDEELGTDGGYNIDSDPLFARDPGTDGEDDPGDLHLTAGSPCIDSGDPSVTGGQDRDGEVRVFDGDEDGTAIVDIGADEYVDADYDGIVDRDDPIVEPNDTDGDDGDSGGSSGGGSSGGCFINTLS